MFEIEELMEKMQDKGRNIKSFLQYRDPELRLTLFYALGYLAKKYLMMAEEAMKQGEEYQANHFSKKAATTRRVCKEVFKSMPEDDYYTGLFKECPKIITKVEQEQIQQLAQYCAMNLEIDEEIVSDKKRLLAEIKEGLKRRKAQSFIKKYALTLRGLVKEYEEKPDKLATILELLILLDMVQEVTKMIKEKSKGELPGFKQ